MPLYALIDCAQDDSLFPMICHEAAQRSLFAGTLSPALIGATPHIVRLDEGRPLRGLVETKGWQQNWGIVCASAAPLLEVRRMFRRNLQAYLPDSRSVLFRFYDPRVWVPYIESCPPEDLPRWFGLVTDYWAPWQGGTVQHRAGQDGLIRRLIPAAAA
jgi:hypothetical protein